MDARRRAIVAGLALLLAACVPATAHEGLHEQIAETTREIAKDPGNAGLYLKRGELYRLHRAWTRAARDYDRALRLDPSLSAVFLARGRMLLESGRPAAAKVSFDRYLAVDPDHVLAVVERARALARLGRARESGVDYSRAIALSPRPEPEYYVERAKVLAAGGFLDEAIRGLDEGIARLGSIVTMELLAIDLELQARSYDAALARVDRVAAGWVRQESWLVRRGEILLLAGRGAEARRAFEAALAAIEALPDHRRGTPAMRALEAKARKGAGGR